MSETPINSIVDAAMEAFWEKVAEAYPTAVAGDFPPDAEANFHHAARNAVRTWELFNVPAAEEEHTPDPTEAEIDEAVEQAKREILADMCIAQSSQSLIMPLSVSNFSQLHDYVDANEYGGLCAERSHWLQNRDPVDHINRFQDKVNAWLESGEHQVEKVAMTMFEVTVQDPHGVSWWQVTEPTRQVWRDRARDFIAKALPELREGHI